MKKAKRLMAFLLALGFVLTCAACGDTGDDPNPSSNSNGTQSDSTDSQSGAGPENETISGDFEISDDTVGKETYILPEITFSNSDNPTSLCPYYTKSTDNTVFYEMYERLFIQDNNDGHLIPVLADATKGGNNPDGVMGYDHEAGSPDYTVYIYDYITDSAGNPITSSDVKFSFQKAYEGGETSSWDAMLPIEDRIECPDDTTIVFHFTEEITSVQILENIWAKCNIFSEKAFNDSPSEFANDACGTGPYVLESFTSDAQIVIKRREDYWQTNEDLLVYTQLANVDRIVMQIISEDSQKVMGLESGDLDYVNGLSYTYCADFLDGGSYSDQFNTYTKLGTSCYNLIPNCDSSSIFSDINMRLALFYALDNEGICAMLGEGTAEPVSAIGNYTQYDYVDEFDTWDNYNTNPDPEKVAEYKELAGYTDQEIHFVSNSNTKALAEVVLNMLLNAGFNVKMDVLDRAVYLDQLADPTAWDFTFVTAAGDYEVFAWSVAMDTANTSHGRTRNFIDDADYQAMLKEVMTVEGHTEEKMKEYWQYTIDHAYVKGLYSATISYVIPNYIQTMAMRGTYILPGACIYTEPNA